MSVRKYTKRLAPVVMAFALVAAMPTAASAAALTTLSVSPSNSTPSATGVTYTVTASNVTTANIQCMRVEFDTAADGSGGKPAGLALGASTITGSWIPTPGSFTASVDNPNGVITSTGTAQTPASASGRTMIINAITNPSVTTSFYVRINTYNNTNCSSSPVDSGVAMATATDNTQVTAVVDPTFTFTVADYASACNGLANSSDATAGATSVNLGRVNTSANKGKNQQFTVSTNAANGYTVFARSTGSMSDGAGHSITDWTGTNATPTTSWAAGTEAFGYTVGDSTLSGTANRFTNGGAKFAGLNGTNAEVAYASVGPVSNDTNCIGYQIGASGSTPAGAYTTAVIYTAVPVF